jgi:hypothetical protein
MFAAPNYNEELLGHPLWHVELTERRVCVAENAEGTYLVLFTSPARAYDFIVREQLEVIEAASPTLYSTTPAEFMSRAETSAAGGAKGVVVDPQANGEVGSIIEFRVDAGGAPEHRTLS